MPPPAPGFKCLLAFDAQVHYWWRVFSNGTEALFNVVFDCDGTLVDSEPLYGRADAIVFSQLGVPIGERFYPRAFVALVHQHEESLAAAAHEPFGAVLGIGSGIRHRAGVHFGLGFDVGLLRRGRFGLALGPELSFAHMTYSSGPGWYVTAGVALTGRLGLF